MFKMEHTLWDYVQADPVQLCYSLNTTRAKAMESWSRLGGAGSHDGLTAHDAEYLESRIYSRRWPGCLLWTELGTQGGLDNYCALTS